MIGIIELWRKYQKPRQELLKVGLWARWVLNPLSVIITWLCLPFPITPDMITFLWLILGGVGCYLFATGNYAMGIIAAVIFQFTLILDGVDGLIARCKKIGKINGVFTESMIHTLVHDIFMGIGITFGAYALTRDITMFALGFATVISFLLHKHIFLEKIHIFIQHKLFLDPKYKISKTMKKATKTSNKKQKKSFAKTIYDIVIVMYRGIGIVNFATVAAVFNRLDIFLWFYGITFPLIILALMVFEGRRGFDGVAEMFKE